MHLQFFFKPCRMFHGMQQQKECIPDQQECLQMSLWARVLLFLPAHWMLAHYSVTHIVLPFERLAWYVFPMVLPGAELLSYRNKARIGDK